MKTHRFTLTAPAVTKPRQTRSDKWKRRPAVMRYRQFADTLRKSCGPVPADVHGINWVAYMPMPKSWSKKKRREMMGEPHRQTPDIDNLEKAVLDALFPHKSGGDSMIYFGSGEKLWEREDGPCLEVELMYEEGT